MHVNVAIGYGGRREIADAVRSLLQEQAARGHVDRGARRDPRRRAHRRAPLHPRPARPRPGDPDLGGAAALRLPALAERAQRVLLLRGAVARLPQGRLPAGAAFLLTATPQIRSVTVRWRAMSRQPVRPHPAAACSSRAGAALAAVAVAAAGEPRGRRRPRRRSCSGAANAGGARTTGLTSTPAGRCLAGLVQRGAGFAASLVTPACHRALRGGQRSATAWGALRAQRRPRDRVPAGACAREGRQATPACSPTRRPQDVPAVVAIGGDGTGCGAGRRPASPTSTATRSLCAPGPAWSADGRRRTSSTPRWSRPRQRVHTGDGDRTLDGAGGAAVALPATFTAACDPTTLAGLAEPGGRGHARAATSRTGQATGPCTGSYDGFAVAGGAAGGTVAWSAWATRRAGRSVRTQAGALAPARTAPGPGRQRAADGPARAVGPGHRREFAPPRSVSVLLGVASPSGRGGAGLGLVGVPGGVPRRGGLAGAAAARACRPGGALAAARPSSRPARPGASARRPRSAGRAAAWRSTAWSAVRLDRGRVVRLELGRRTPGRRRAGRRRAGPARPSRTATTSSPVSVLCVSRACASASTWARFSRSISSALARGGGPRFGLDPLPELRRRLVLLALDQARRRSRCPPPALAASPPGRRR